MEYDYGMKILIILLILLISISGCAIQDNQDFVDDSNIQNDQVSSDERALNTDDDVFNSIDEAVEEL